MDNQDDETGESTNRILTEQEVDFIVKNIGLSWALLARKLSLNETTIFELSGELSATDRGYNLIRKWQQFNGILATKQCIIAALVKADRNDIVDKLLLFRGREKQEPTIMLSDPCSADLNTLQKELKKKYRDLRMPQPLGTKDLRAGDTFIDQEMKVVSNVYDDLEVRIEEIFENHDPIVRRSKKQSDNRFITWLKCRENRINIIFPSMISCLILPLLNNLSIILKIPIIFLAFFAYWHVSSKTQLEKNIAVVKVTSMEEKVTRILIEGDPGYGKTTLATKLAVDWAKGKEYIASRFELVFLLPLKDIQGSVKDAVKSMCEHMLTNGVDDKLLKKLFDDQRRVLYILDGYDDMNEGNQTNLLLQTLQQKISTLPCFLVTSRRGVFSDRETRTIGSLHYHHIDHKFWDTRLVLKGFSNKEQKEFLKRHFADKYEDLKSKLKRFIHKEKKDDLFSCPFFLFWLVNMHETSELEHVKTKTTFFKMLFNYVAKKCLVAVAKIPDSCHFDLFERENSEIVRIVKAELKELGQLGLDSYLHDLTFDENKVSDCQDKILLKSDLFAKVKKPTRNAIDEIHYQPLHKSLLEFMAAFSLTEATRDNKDEFVRIIRNLVKNGLFPSEFSLFYPFVAGLLEDKVCWLFEALEPWAVLFHARKQGMISLFVELLDVNANVIVIESLRKFIPTSYSLCIFSNFLKHYLSSPFHQQLLQYSLSKELVSIVEWNMGVSIPRNAEFFSKKLDYIRLRPSDAIPSQPTIWSAIRCKDLIISFSQDIRNRQTWKNYLAAFLKLNADNRHIILGDCSVANCTRVLDEVERKSWKDITLQRIRLIDCPLLPSHVNTLINLIQTGRLTKGLFLQFNDTIPHKLSDKLVEDLWTAVVNSSLTEFSFNNHDVKFIPTFDFSLINDSRETPFEFMYFFGFFLPKDVSKVAANVHDLTYPFNPLADSDLSHIDRLNANCFNFVRRCKNLKRLHSQLEVVSAALHFNSFEELELPVKGSFSIPELEVSIDQLDSLKVLVLNLQDFDSRKLDIPNQLEDFLTSILEKRRLQILGFLIIRSAYFFLKLLKMIKNVKPGDFLLNSLELVLEKELDPKETREVFAYLNQLMKERHLGQVAFSYFHISDSHQLDFTRCFPEDEFLFLSEIDGYSHDHSRFCQENFQRFMTVHDRLVIKPKVDN